MQRGDNVAQQRAGRCARGVHVPDVRRHVAGLQRRRHALHALVLGEKVFGALDGDGGDLPRETRANLRRGKIRLVYITQNRLAERFGNGGHVVRDGGVVRRKTVVARVGIHGAEHIPVRAEIKGDARNVRAVLVGKIDLCDAAECARGLIHQSARLAEIVPLGALADTRERERVGASSVIKRGEDRAGEDLKRRRGRKSASGGDERVDARPPSSDAKPSCGKPRRDAADERGGRAGLVRARREIGERYAHSPKSVGDDLHGVVRRGRGSGGGVQRDRGAEHNAELMVGVVPGKLRAPRRADQKRVRRVAERPEIFPAKPPIACPRRVRRTVEHCERGVILSGGQPVFPYRNIHRVRPSGSFIYTFDYNSRGYAVSTAERRKKRSSGGSSGGPAYAVRPNIGRNRSAAS